MKIIVHGATGRMGQNVLKLVRGGNDIPGIFKLKGDLILWHKPSTKQKKEPKVYFDSLIPYKVASPPGFEPGLPG